MKRRILSFALICMVMLLSFSFPTATAQVKAQTIAETDSLRFENMLNHNYLFGDDFNDINKVVDKSIIPLLDKRDGDFIREDIVKSFVENMYDFDIEGYAPNTNAPLRDGYIFIMPMGYENISHKIISVSANDLLYCVVSEITFITHDGETETATCETVFLENQNSAFGYNIISANISE